MIEQLIFYFFACLAVLFASFVVISKNPVRSVLCLVMTFVSTSVLWLLLEMEFLSFLLILVYVGAVIVLFLFVVFMLNIRKISNREGFTNFLPVAICIPLLLLILLVYAVGPNSFGVDKIIQPERYSLDYKNIVIIAEVLFTRYLFHFVLAGILLLVAMIAAISLTYRGTQKRRSQVPEQQVRATKENRLILIKNHSDLMKIKKELKSC